MARLKPIHKGLKRLPVDFEQQIISGSFEYWLCHQVEHDLDLSASHVRYLRMTSMVHVWKNSAKSCISCSEWCFSTVSLVASHNNVAAATA